MRFATWFENSEYDRLMADYRLKEPEYLANPAIAQELQTTGSLSLRTVQRALGVSEGEANFIVRNLLKTHADPAKAAAYAKSQEVPDTDEFYYHVTLKRNLPKIRRMGLRPDSTPMFSNYTQHSGGRVFLCEKNGVNFWKMRVEQHVHHNTGKVLQLVVIRFPKQAVPQVFPDDVGTTDSRYPSYYTTQTVPPQQLQIVG